MPRRCPREVRIEAERNLASRVGNTGTMDAETIPPESQEAAVPAEPLDPNDSARLKDQIRGQTTEHASPPRLEDEGQAGG